MAVRSTMSSLISRIRTLINDPSGTSQNFSDQDVQDVLDESRIDLRYLALQETPSYVSGTLQYLDYYIPPGNGNLEDGMTLWQYLYSQVTPATIEPITGHFTFTLTTLPPVYIIGKTYDIYRAAADLLERLASRYATRFAFSSDGQSFQVQQVMIALLDLAHTYRMKQRVQVSKATRSDLSSDVSEQAGNGGPIALDYFSSGDIGR